MNKIRILHVDEHALWRDALRMLLAAESDLEVVGEAGTESAALKQCQSVNAHVILLGLNVKDHISLSLIPSMRQHCPSSRVIVVSGNVEPEFVRSALAAGAAGYVSKTSRASVLLDAIRAVQSGETFLDPSVQTHAPKMKKPVRMAEAAPIARLSARERQVLHWLAKGLTYQAIADKIGISVKTVETYRSRLTSKLGFQNRSDMMRFVIELGILEEPPPTGPD